MGLTGASSKQNAQVRRLAEGLPHLLTGPLGSTAPAARVRQVQHRLTSEQVEQLVHQYESGEDMKQLAVRWGLHRSTVAGHLKRVGVALRRQGLSGEQLAEAVRLYGEGWSLQRLGERYGCDPETVRKNLKRSGVCIRRPWVRP